MTFLSFVSAFCSVMSLVIGSIVLRENVRSAQNRIFALFCFIVAFIAFSEFGYRQSESVNTAYFWFKLAVISPLVTPLIMHFIFNFTHYNKRKTSGIVLFAAYIGSALFTAIDLFTGQISGAPAHSVWGWDHRLVSGMWYQLYIYWTITLYLFSVGLIIYYHMKVAVSTEKLRSRFTMFAFLIICLLTLTTEKVMPFIDFEFPELSTLGYVMANALIGYAMWKYRLFSISPISAAGKIVETISDGLLLIDNNGIVVTVNSAAEKMFKFNDGSLLQRNICELFLDNEFYSDAVAASKNWTVSVADFSSFFKSAQPQGVPVSIATSILTNRHGEKAGTVMIARNITERLNAQKALQDANENLERRVAERTMELAASNRELSMERDKLDVTLRSIGDGVVVTSTDCRIQIMNKTAENIIGFTMEQVSGKRIQDVFRIACLHDECQTPDPVGNALASGRVVKLEDDAHLLRTADSSVKRIEDSAAPVVDNMGKTIGCVLVFRDITEKYAIQQELFKVKRLESVSSLAAGIACDFDNILKTITNNLLMIKLMANQTPDTVKLINDTEQITHNAVKLTQQLLGFSGTADSGDAQIESVSDLISSSIGFFIKNKTTDYELVFDEHLMNVTIDKKSFDAVMSNLIANAEDAISVNGMIIVEAHNISIRDSSDKVYAYAKNRDLEFGNYVSITVRDNGHGISENIKEQAFDPFFSTRGSNRGLGLSVVYSIVKKFRGTVYFEPSVSEGCAITFLLPSTDQSTSAQLSVSKKDLYVEETNFPGGNILLAGVGQIATDSVTETLRSIGFTVNSISDSALYFESVNKESDACCGADVVIADLDSDISGNIFRMISELREHNPALLSIALKNPLSGTNQDSLLKTGFDFVFSKPFNLSELVKMILQPFRE